MKQFKTGEKLNGFLKELLKAPSRPCLAQAGILEGELEGQPSVVDKKDVSKASSHLEKVLPTLGQVDEGKELVSKGKWANWCRGANKMNMEYVRERT